MLPKHWKWVEDINPQPKILQVALKYYGIQEIPGPRSNEKIMGMAKSLNVESIYTNDDMAWCALFICFCLVSAGKPMPYKNYEVIRAASFIGEGNTHPEPWGEEVPINEARYGDLVYLQRPGGGHIAIMIARTKSGNFILFGGNQKNSVGFMETSKDRVKGVRRYYKTGLPSTAQIYTINSTGELSKNEA